MLSIIVVPQRGKDPESCSLECVCYDTVERGSFGHSTVEVKGKGSSVWLAAVAGHGSFCTSESTQRECWWWATGSVWVTLSKVR